MARRPLAVGLAVVVLATGCSQKNREPFRDDGATLDDPCDYCQGTGLADYGGPDCIVCEGSGLADSAAAAEELDRLYGRPT